MALLTFTVHLQRTAFFATRILLGFTSSLCEASLVTAVAEAINTRVAKYMLVMLLFSAGMFESSTALLPSTFTMYTSTLALSYSFYPSRSGRKLFPSNTSLAYTPAHRTVIATFSFALGALVGWPFALVLSLPFVFEELFVSSGLLVPSARYVNLIKMRLFKWSRAVLYAALIAVPLIIIDTLAYARFTLVPLNIIVYNILSSRRGAGPELYGVEPWFFYLFNLLLNFGPALPLALVSLPAVLFTMWYEPKRFAAIEVSKEDQKDHDTSATKLQGSSETTLLVLRLAPLYLWLGLLTLQPHKEERFMIPAYPLLCFNAAITLSLARGWLERWYTNVTKSPYRASKTYLFTAFTSFALLVTSLFCLSRVIQLSQSYRAPISLLNHLHYHELPRVVAQLWPLEQSSIVQDRLRNGLPPVFTEAELAGASSQRQYESSGIEKEAPLVDLKLLTTHNLGNEELLRLCYGKEWFRFPATYLVPDGVSVDFVKSEFDGILPKHFKRAQDDTDITIASGLDIWLGWIWPWKDWTRVVHSSFNDMNREEPDQYVDVDTCDYLVDVDFPHSAVTSKLEPRHVRDGQRWTPVKCLPFLDNVGSRAPPNSGVKDKVRSVLDRVLWLPKALRGNTNRYGDYCLLRTTRETSHANAKSNKSNDEDNSNV
jgi:alpha-1,2-mannosyltransferase